MIPRATYEAIQDGWVAGVRVTAGDRIDLTAAEAKYEHVRPVPAEPDAPRAGRKLRRVTP